MSKERDEFQFKVFTSYKNMGLLFIGRMTKFYIARSMSYLVLIVSNCCRMQKNFANSKKNPYFAKAASQIQFNFIFLCIRHFFF